MITSSIKIWLFILLFVSLLSVTAQTNACLFIEEADKKREELSQEYSEKNISLIEKIIKLTSWYNRQIEILEKELGKPFVGDLVRVDFSWPLNDVAYSMLAKILSDTSSDFGMYASDFENQAARLNDLTPFDMLFGLNIQKFFIKRPYSLETFAEEKINNILSAFNKTMEEISDNNACQIEMHDSSLGYRIKIPPKELQDRFISYFPDNKGLAIKLCLHAMDWCLNNALNNKKLIIPDLKKFNDLILNYPEYNKIKGLVTRTHKQKSDVSYRMLKKYMKEDKSRPGSLSLYESALQGILQKLESIADGMKVGIISSESKQCSYHGGAFILTEEAIPPSTDLYVLQIVTCKYLTFNGDTLKKMSELCGRFFLVEAEEMKVSPIYGVIADFSILQDSPKIKIESHYRGSAILVDYFKGQMIEHPASNIEGHSMTRSLTPYN
ncbi:MAG: hypothetical protein PUP46_08940 [Endozoicomonas sp. (ex Botrylloides leachii)]|nr:hypothetical protein [Endozoicomonas sp. (ex Botrylloides leachii)]